MKMLTMMSTWTSLIGLFNLWVALECYVTGNIIGDKFQHMPLDVVFPGHGAVHNATELWSVQMPSS
jgi:hypothetical protein